MSQKLIKKHVARLEHGPGHSGTVRVVSPGPPLENCTLCAASAQIRARSGLWPHGPGLTRHGRPCCQSGSSSASAHSFYFDGSKRALIYEYMANGSLEKFIYDRPLEAQPQLGWDTLYQIVVGVARGLEYSHRGCNTCILHFDIKPHNILLDLDFSLKISDFGLANLCPRNESIISMLDARGTAGYIAPEVFNRQFGGVSLKSDVYSYGMKVLDIVAKRENIDISINRSSEIYFPNWIHKRLKLNEDLGLNGIMSAEELDKVKKMTSIALWCIQLNHMDRPTMTKVVEMLEATHELLSIPPNPYLYSPPRSPGSPVSSPTT